MPWQNENNPVMKHSAFYKNTLWQYVLQFIKYLLPLLTLPYLTRILEPEGYAVYAYVASFMTFAQTFVDFGFNLSGTKSVASAQDQDLGLLVGSISQARVLLCVLAGGACVAIGCFIPIMRENAMYAALAYIAVCGRALAPDFLFQGKEQMAPITLRYLASKGTSTVLTFVFVRSSSDLLWVPVLDIVASAIALVWSFRVADRLFGLRIQWAAPERVLHELCVSGYYCLSNMASAAFSGFTTLVIGIAISDAAQISYWSLTMSAVSAVQSLYSPITNSLYPHMVVGGDFRFAKRLIALSLPFVLGGTVLFCVVADFIVLILGGPEYLPAAYLLRIVSPVLFFSFYGMLIGWPILGAMGKVKELTKTTVVSSMTSAAALCLVTLSGSSSVSFFALIRCATEFLMCVLRVYECRKAFRLKRSMVKE